MKTELKDLTITIPFRKDSQDRLENILFVIDYIQHWFDVDIMVYEDSPTSTEELSSKPGIIYKWIENHSPVFHRTKILNDMAKAVKTKIVANWDADTTVPVSAILDAYNLILHDVYDVVYPYSGEFNECSREWLPKLREEFNFRVVPKNNLNCLNPNSVGGIIFENREKFLSIGGEVTAFRGWGFEDLGRISIFHKLGFRVVFLDNYLLHIEHFRGSTSNEKHPDYIANLMEYRRIDSLTREQLIEEIKQKVQ